MRGAKCQVCVTEAYYFLVFQGWTGMMEDMELDKRISSLCKVISSVFVGVTAVGLPSVSYGEETSSIAAAQNMSAEEQYELANNYLVGIGGVEQSPEKFLNLLYSAAQAGYDKAVVDIACLLLEGSFVPKSVENGSLMLNEEVAKGSAYAMGCMGAIKCIGMYGLPQDVPGGLKLLKEAVEKGDADSMAALGMLKMAGIEGGEHEVQEGIRMIQLALQQENEAAMFLWGLAKLNGCPGVSKNETEAVNWLKKAADKGFVSAMPILGNLLIQGKGATRDVFSGMDYLRRAVIADDATAMVILAKIYSDGIIVQEDASLAVRLLNRAVELEDAEAQALLGDLYLQGKGVTQSDNAAVKWYRKAAEQGHIMAQVSLGNLYMMGKGVPQSDAAALSWWRRAAEQDSAFAWFMLGRAYSEGIGVACSSQEAENCFNKAVEIALTMEDGLHEQLLSDIQQYVSSKKQAQAHQVCIRAQEMGETIMNVYNQMEKERAAGLTDGVYHRMISLANIAENCFREILNHSSSCSVCGHQARQEMRQIAVDGIAKMNDLRQTCQKWINRGCTGDSFNDFMVGFKEGMELVLPILPLLGN